MVIVIICDLPDRFRGFLASHMLEVGQSVFVSPHMNRRVRERIWDVVADWYRACSSGSLLLCWSDPAEPGGVGLRSCGLTPRQLVEVDGLYLTRREYVKEDEKHVERFQLYQRPEAKSELHHFCVATFNWLMVS